MNTPGHTPGHTAGTAFLKSPIDKLFYEFYGEQTFRSDLSISAGELGICKAGNWWFRAWQPDTVTLPDGKRVAFSDADPEVLANNPSCRMLNAGDIWHGFPDMSKNWAMLDPTKVTVLTPGMNDDGTHAEFGIPSAIVLAYLDTKGIINEKSGDYNILFLLSMGVTKGKWGTLMSVLFDFKTLFDANTPLEEVLPELVKAYPDRYTGMTLQTLARRCTSTSSPPPPEPACKRGLCCYADTGYDTGRCIPLYCEETG